jgi:eukaryotic-like serine/threonine-protein kinase
MIGQNIGKYRVLDRVGRGGMGTVYLAIDETLHREVAIKVLNAELNDPEVAKRFRAEAITVARLNHPGLATIFELFQHEGQWLMVMEFVRGETLEHLVERSGSLSPQRGAELCMQALAALAHAHSMGVVHRDLKPANLMITENGAVKIMDFGIARVAGTEHLTNAGFMMGTPAYMAPEQVLGHEIDARADLYAMGVVFYRLTTGKLPFKGETPFAMAQSQVNDPPTPVGLMRSDLPAWVEQVVVRALAKKADDRFQSAVEFHEAFARCLAGLPMMAPKSASAPTELMITPPRAMPTGSLGYGTPMGTSRIEPTPPVEETRLTPPPARPPAPEPEPAALAARDADPDVTRPPDTPLKKRPVTKAPPPVPVGGKVAGPTPSGPPAASVKKSGPSAGVIGTAAVVVLVIAGGAYWALHRSAPPAPPTDSAAGSTPEAGSQGAMPEAPPAVAEPPVAPPPAAGGQTTPVAAGTTPTPSSSAAGRGGRSTSTAPVSSGVAAPPPRAADPLLTVDNVKVMIVNGTKTDAEDALLQFGDGRIVVMTKKDSSVIATVAYARIQRATYVKARDPRWDPSLFSPPDGLDVGTMLRPSRNWLVLQMSDAYLILRLEDANFNHVIEAIDTRTDVKVDRSGTGGE